MSRKNGFTILEVLIALTAALLLMLGLTRTYKLLADKITERQSQLELSSKLRDVAIRLRDELERATCSMNPPASEAEDEGYLVYHEGPFSAATTALGSTQNPAPLDTDYFRDSRYGDIDDYLAFTARADADSPFVGFIPRGVLAVQQFASGQLNVNDLASYGHRQATELVPFYSRVAEIAYWAAPRYVRDSADGTLVYGSATPSTIQPVAEDRNDDLIPDRLDLHRRVLLVRPDLNMTPAEMSTANAQYGSSNFTVIAATSNVPTIPFLTRDDNGDVIVVPLSFGIAGNQSFFPSRSFNSPTLGVNTIKAPGDWWNTADGNNLNYASPNWLTGVARVQQVMDLSISRVTDTWSTPAAGRSVPMNGTSHFGMPSAVLQANTLGDLTRPENRFGFVRIPSPIINGLPGSSMPQLALCPPHRYLMSRFTTPPTPPTNVNVSDHVLGPPWPSTFPAQADDARLTLPTGDPDFENPFGKFTMTTFLRPEFSLADRITDRNAFDRGGTNAPVEIVNRGGSDVIATDVVGFDIRIFDPQAPKLAWEGRDRVPGGIGDDDGDTLAPDDTRGPNSPLIETDELGLPGTDDEAIAIDSLRINEALLDNGTRVASGQYDFAPARRTRFGLIDRGDFVDLGYARNAGGAMRGLFQFDLGTTTVLRQDNLLVFSSPFSGVQRRQMTPGIQTNIAFPDSWLNSGRFILRTGTGSPVISSFYQATYDTWTDGYATDQFDQEGLASVSPFSYTREPIGGSGAIAGSFTERRVPQDNSATTPQTANLLSSPVQTLPSVRWTSLPSSFTRTGSFSGESAGVIQTAPTSPQPFEVTAPIPQPLKAIKITIRVDDFSAETIRQQTVIQEF